MTAVPPTVNAETARAPEQIVRHGVLRQLVARPLALISVTLLAFLVLIAIIQPWIMPFSVSHVDLSLTNVAPFSSEYVLGGDKYGRDILSVLIAGTRNAMVAGFILAAIALTLGTVLGLIAGYVQGPTDIVMSGVNSILLAVPGIILLIALYTLVDVSMPVAMATLGVLSSTGVFLLVRSLTRNVRAELYVDAARVSGLPVVRIIGRHVLLAIRGPVIIQAAFLFGGALAISAGLDFLGLGDPSKPSWGSVLNDAFINYYIAPWQLIWPGVVLGVAMASFVLLGNALRDVLEGVNVRPSSRARRARERRLLASIPAPGPASPESVDRCQRDAKSTLLRIEGLRVGYAAGGALNVVVDDVDLDVAQGEVVGLVGESGSGKTQTVFAALGLLPDEAIVAGGQITFDGTRLDGDEGSYAGIRGSQMAYVPQEPMSNLDPSFRVGHQLVEGIRAQRDISRRAARELALEMLARVGIRDPRRTCRSYPHELSGGMAQRVLIAGAVATRPRLLIADEPTTALDVTVQAEVLDMLRDLRAEIGMGILLVTHNLGVVADLCDRVVVMRTGVVVEQGTVRNVLRAAEHPYTQMLIGALLEGAEPRDPLTAEEERA